jgi:pimeloyl-ACP methyl ester carboxylesterase
MRAARRTFRASAVRAGSQAGGYPGLVVARRTDDLESLGLGALFFLWRQHGGDGDSLDLELGVNSYYVAGLRPFEQEGTVEDAARLESPCGPPGPGTVRPRAGQLDLNPAGHVLNLQRRQGGVHRGRAEVRRYAPVVRTEPVLLVHGFASSFEREWREPGWVDLLTEAGREVIALDLLGHGTAQKPHDPGAYADLEACVEGVLPAGQVVDAIGFSLGAQLLLAVASRVPDRFGRLVLGGVGTNVFSQGSVEDVARAVERGDGGADDASVARAFAQFATAPGNDRDALAACLRGRRRRLDPAQLAGLTCPVLVVLGDRDFAGPADPLVEALPDARLVTLRGADHFGTPKDFRFLDAAFEFLDAVPA